MRGTEPFGRKMFRRLLLFNLFIVIIATVAPQFVFYSSFVSLYDDEVKALNMQTVRQFRNAVDEPIVRAVVNFPNVYLSELESNEALVYPLTHDIARSSGDILKVSRRVDDIINNMPFVHSIDIYYKAGNLLFLGNRVCMLNISACDLGGSSDWFERFATTDINIDWVSSRRAGRYDPASIATYVRSIPYFGGQDVRQGIVAVNLDLADISDSLRSLRSPAEGMLLIVDGAGKVLARNDTDAELPEPELDPYRLQLYDGDDVGMFDAQLDGQASVVSFMKSQYNDWRYVSITSVETMYRKLNNFGNGMLAIGGTLLACGVLAAVFLTSRAHKPISSRLDSMQRSLDRHLPIVRHNTILRLLFGSVSDAERSVDAAAALGIDHADRRVRSFALKIVRPDSLPEREAMAEDFHLIERLQEGFVHGRLFAIRDERSHMLGFLHFASETDAEDIARQMQAIVEHEDGNQRDYSLCFGSEYPSGDEQIARSFGEADEALEYAFLLPDAKVILYEELGIPCRKESGIAPKTIDELAAAIRAGEEKRFAALAAETMGELRTGGYSIRYCRNVLDDIVSAIDKIVLQAGFQSTDLFGSDMREKFRSVPNIVSFEERLIEAARAAAARINERKQQYDPEFAANIVAFVNNNIMNQISLDLVAEHAGVSPTYISKIFKHITGSNFSEYVTERKMEQAASLLRERKLSVQEISYRIGYQSTHHFIRLFKEKYGLTPKQYQKSRMEGGAAQDEK